MFSTAKVSPQDTACTMSPDISDSTEFNMEVDGIPSAVKTKITLQTWMINMYYFEVDKKGMLVGRHDEQVNDEKPDAGFIWPDYASYSTTIDTNTFYIGPNYHIKPTFFLPSGITSLSNIQLKDIKTGAHKLSIDKDNPVFNSERISDFTYSWKVGSNTKIDEPSNSLKLQDGSCNTYTTTATGDTKFKTCTLSTESESTWEIRTGFDKENVNTAVMMSASSMLLNAKIVANNVSYDLSKTASIDIPFISTNRSINYSYILTYITKSSDSVNINLLMKPEGYCTIHNNGSLKTCIQQSGSGKWQITTTDAVTAKTTAKSAYSTTKNTRGNLQYNNRNKSTKLVTAPIARSGILPWGL